MYHHKTEVIWFSYHSNSSNFYTSIQGSCYHFIAIFRHYICREGQSCLPAAAFCHWDESFKKTMKGLEEVSWFGGAYATEPTGKRRSGKERESERHCD